MIAEEKNTIVGFLDLAADYLKDGYKRDRKSHAFEDDARQPEQTNLPLAYIMEEAEEDENFPYKNDDSLYNSVIDNSVIDDSLFDGSIEKDSLETIAADIAACKTCGLAATRNLVVPGEGAERPIVMVIGEGPGAEEDKAGRPFVGRAGQLLDKMLESIALFRNENCFIANMVKCRPPGNRDPAYEEIAACYPFLERQITLLHPRFILCAGRVAAQNLLKTSTGINALRGEFKELRIGETVIPVLCTYHPSAILRNESLKRPAWEDLKRLKSRMEERD